MICALLGCFNPRVLAGGRDPDTMIAVTWIWFQSTRPRGRTRHAVAVSASCPLCVSIHASSREDATSLALMLRGISCFNPRVLAGGRDPPISRVVAVQNVSIHASSREDATRGASCRGVSPRFQSTRPRGRTRLALVRSRKLRQSFNPRVLAGGRDRLL